MAKPKIEVEDKKYYRDIHFLYKVLHSLNNVEEIKLFIKDILTRSELRMLKRRWHIANLLLEGLDIRTVAMKSKTSTQTVSKIKQILEEGNGGLLLALNRVGDRMKKEKSMFSKTKKLKGGSKLIKNWF